MNKNLILPFTLVLVLSISCNQYSNVGGDTTTIEENLKNRTDIVFFGGFDENFNDSLWIENWGINYLEFGLKPEIVNNGFKSSKSLRVKYPIGGIGPKETGVSFPIVLREINNIEKKYYDSLYMRYYVKFEDGFDFRLGGKLPGMMGGGNSWTRSGGQQPDGTNGWTLRFMWRENGVLKVYAYLPESGNGKYGGQIWGQDLDCSFTFTSSQWHCIEQFVHIGQPGKDNGKLIVWINGEKKLELIDLRFWNIENNYGRIGGFYFSTFHGGNTKEWGPQTDSFAQFDGIVLATKRIGM